MKYGLSNEELNFLYENIVSPLKNSGAKVYIFGSRANGKYKKFSDIDLLYTSNSSQTIPTSLISQILIKIEESNFAYKIDLVNELELATSYRSNIESEKIEL